MDADAIAYAENLSNQMKSVGEAYESACKEWDVHHQVVSRYCRDSINGTTVYQVNAMKARIAAMEELSQQKKILGARRRAASDALLAHLDKYKDVTMLRKYFSNVRW